MQKTIIRYGLISGAIAAVLLVAMVSVMKAYGFSKVGFDNSAYFGYSLIILSMAVIFFGIKAFRDNENDGKITFLQGLIIGLGITLISCVCYSLMWLVVFYNFMPNFMNDYVNYCMEKHIASGASEAALKKAQEELEFAKKMYQTPFGIFAITLTEPLPVGILVALVSALILKRK